MAASQRFGRFRLLQALRSRTELQIWHAEPADTRSDYPSDMVLFRWQNTPEGAGQARQFSQLLAQVPGPGLDRCIETSDAESIAPYVLCEHFVGLPLSKLISAGPLSYRLAVHVAGEVLRVLDRLHAAGFVSGQTTLDSVHLTEAGEVMLLGLYGAAKVGHASSAARHASGATLRALSPEVARGETLSPRSDIYGVGVLLLELLIGGPWVQGEDLDMLARAQSGDASHTNFSALNIPEGLRSELARSLQANPGLRHSDAIDFADNLFAFGASDAKATLSELTRAALRRNAQGQLEIQTAPPPASAPAFGSDDSDEDDAHTSRFHMSPSFVTTRRGERIGPLSYAQLVEKTVGGAFASDDMVELMGSPALGLGQVEELARLLPAARVPTKRPQGFTPEQSALSLLAELSALYTNRSTAVLSIQRAKGTSSDVRHLHVKDGIVTSVDTREPGDLLGEYLVQSGQLPRLIVDEALAALPHYKGQLGQALIGEGAASSLFVFRAIVMHLSRRFVSSSAWEDVFVAVETTTAVRPVLFPVRLCVPQLMHEWLDAFERSQGIQIARAPNPVHELGPFSEEAPVAHDLAHAIAGLTSVLRLRRRWGEALPLVMDLGITETQAIQAWHVLSLL